MWNKTLWVIFHMLIMHKGKLCLKIAFWDICCMSIIVEYPETYIFELPLRLIALK